MALAFRVISRYGHNFSNLTKPVKWPGLKNNPLKVMARGASFTNNIFAISPESHHSCLQINLVRQCSTQSNPNQTPDQNIKKQSLVKKLKEMYKSYWYVVIPVHLCTSVMWFGSAYFAVKSGVDVIGLLQSLGVKESLIAPLRDSGVGYYALAFALYKVVTPLRYAVTIGGTTYAIKKLTSLGLIKPVPSTKTMKEMYKKKKNDFIESKEYYKTQMKEKSENFMDEMKEKRTTFMDEIKRYKAQVQDKKISKQVGSKSERDKN